MIGRRFIAYRNLGDFAANYFSLLHRGAHTVEHAHAQGHLIEGSQPIIVYAMTPGGPSAQPRDAWDSYWAPAGIRHMVVAVNDGETRVRCLFPKAGDKSFEIVKPYEEETPIENLNGFVQAELAKYPAASA